MVSLGRLLIMCPDRPGIVATVSEFLFQQGANITHSSQHSTDPADGMFFMRIEFTLDQISSRIEVLRQAFQPISTKFGMDCQWIDCAIKKRMAILVTKESHCLIELLGQIEAGDLSVDVPLVLSNHETLRPIVDHHRIPFIHVPIQAHGKEAGESAILQAVAGCDFLVLARYMQVLGEDFLNRWHRRVINIHHSFLPAFAGANPYRQACERGVKLIGATAHYVTAELDAGPIIDQDVERVTHEDTVDDLRRIGRHVERLVLARAVQWHLEDRLVVHGNRTIVFK